MLPAKAPTTAPTATSGHELQINDTMYLSTPEVLDRIRFIRRDGTDAPEVVANPTWMPVHGWGFGASEGGLLITGKKVKAFFICPQAEEASRQDKAKMAARAAKFAASEAGQEYQARQKAAVEYQTAKAADKAKYRRWGVGEFGV